MEEKSPSLELPPLVESGWLQENLEHPNLRIVDSTVFLKIWPFPRAKSGAAKYRKEHIPGAMYFDLLKTSKPQMPWYSFSLPSEEEFAQAVGALGISHESWVVVYDRTSCMWATRLWWLFRVFGFSRVSVLNGGLTNWKKEKRPMSSKPCSYEPAEFKASYQEGLVVTKEDVLQWLGDPEVCLVNALGRRQHAGKSRLYGRRGHIPGSLNVTAWEILDRKTKKYRSRAELEAKFSEVLKSSKVVTYCGAGIAASSDAFILNYLGHKDVSIYDAGLVEWCKDRDLPLNVE